MLATLGRGLARALQPGLQALQRPGVGEAWLGGAAPAKADAAAPFSSGAGGVDVDGECATINDLFAQAREDIADARDDAETVYFNESAHAAREAVDEVLSRWDGLLQRVSERQRGELVRSMGLKMEQLKAELKELDELHA